IHTALGAGDFWGQFRTDWVCLDAELMPWSAKAQELLRRQYAATGTAVRASLAESAKLLKGIASPSEDVHETLERISHRREAVDLYVEAYRRYCWPVQSLDDLKLAPFHLLATEGKVYAERNHVWHMEKLAEICRADRGLLLATQFAQVDVTDTA